jgi:hypothetical protein
VAVGQQVRVSLPSRGSGGFGWSFNPEGDAGVISIARVAGERPPLPPAGGPPPNSFSLDEVLVITGVRPGAVVLNGRLARPGGEQAPIEQRRIRVEVVAAAPHP